MGQMTGSDARTNKLKFWMFGIFVLVSAAVTAVLAAVGGGNIGVVIGEMNYWLMIAAAAVLCIVGYLVLVRVGKK